MGALVFLETTYYQMTIIFKLGFWISLLFTCRVHDPEISEKIIDSVEYQESRGNIFVKGNKYCTGLMQVDYRYTAAPRKALRIPIVNRVVGTRALRNWKRRAGGNLKLALASYNCGNAGLKGTCGSGYASAVMARNIHRPRLNLPECWLITQLINSYLDNADYLVKWRNNIWPYLRLHPHQQQRQ